MPRNTRQPARAREGRLPARGAGGALPLHRRRVGGPPDLRDDGGGTPERTSRRGERRAARSRAAQPGPSGARWGVHAIHRSPCPRSAHGRPGAAALRRVRRARAAPRGLLRPVRIDRGAPVGRHGHHRGPRLRRRRRARDRPDEVREPPRPGASARGPALARAGAARAQGLHDAVVVPVPLHPSRLAERGFNQSALVARRVARRLGAPFVPLALARTRETLRQASLERDARAANVRGAFAVRDRGIVRGRAVLLVDDVQTTGATLEACARTLLDAGATSVARAVVAAAETRTGSPAAAQSPRLGTSDGGVGLCPMGLLGWVHLRERAHPG